MIDVRIPGFGRLRLEHLVCDHNGTLAMDGRLAKDVASALSRLSGSLEIHVVTGDTFGDARQRLAHLPCRVTVLPARGQAAAKRAYVAKLGRARTVCLGNGRNDRLMVKDAALGIALIEREGASSETVRNADIVCRSPRDALDLLLNTKRLIATLRS